ncbi:MAG TPA: hypothetical protein VFZ66_23780 [Herpetosiphonaceae bacterium]
MIYSDHNNTARRLPWSEAAADRELEHSAALVAGAAETGLPAIRWYRIAPPALVLGVSQQPHEVNLAACAARGVPVHRRASGGGAVLCDEALLMLDLAFPRGHPLALSDITASYQWLGTAWAATLAELGVDAQLVPVAEARADAQTLEPLVKRVCFAGLSPYEVVSAQRKVVGLAQLRGRGGVLFQAAIHLRWRPERTAELMAVTPSERAILTDWLGRRVVGLEEQCGRAVEAAEVSRSFETALERQTGMRLLDDDWSDDERAAGAAAHARFAELVP